MTVDDLEENGTLWWTAEVSMPGMAPPVTVGFAAPACGASAKQEIFCREVLEHLPAIWEQCRAVLDPVFEGWHGGPLSVQFEEVQIIGLTLPSDKDPQQAWDIMLDIPKTQRIFVIWWDRGRPTAVAVDS